jgi:hypothetical protein
MWRAAGDSGRVRARARRLREDPHATAREHARILLLLGRAAADSGRHRESADALRDALAGAPFEPAIAIAVAVEAASAAIRAGDPQGARHVLKRVERRGAAAFPVSGWLDLEATLAMLDAHDGDLLAATDRLDHVGETDGEQRRMSGRALTRARERIRRQLRQREAAVTDAGAGERRQLAAALSRQPEPKEAALRWAIAAQEARARAELALAQGGTPPVDRARAALPHAGEALVVLGNDGEHVHAWVVRADAPATHLELTDLVGWQRVSAELVCVWKDASGWPDGVVPAERTRDGSQALESAAREMWTPLWPALEGVARVAVAPDPQLAALPWSALALAAPPLLRPRPRAVTVLPYAMTLRTSRWQDPSGRVLAMSHRTASLALGEREAKAVVRLLGGNWLDAIQLRDGVSNSGESLSRHLRGVHLWHLAAPIALDPEQPHASGVPAGDGEIPLWRLTRVRTRLRLMTATARRSEGPTSPPRGTVVGRITPEGPRRVRRTSSGAPSPADAGALARMLVGSIASRLVLNTGEADSNATAALLGSFYAGLARGDTPAESLFLAQRKAFEEGLHPATWAGFVHWGWF